MKNSDAFNESRASIEAEREDMRRTSLDMKRQLQQARFRLDQFLERLKARAEQIENEPARVRLVKVRR